MIALLERWRELLKNHLAAILVLLFAVQPLMDICSFWLDKLGMSTTPTLLLRRASRSFAQVICGPDPYITKDFSHSTSRIRSSVSSTIPTNGQTSTSGHHTKAISIPLMLTTNAAHKSIAPDTSWKVVRRNTRPCSRISTSR